MGRPPTRKLSGRKTFERQRASPLDFQGKNKFSLKIIYSFCLDLYCFVPLFTDLLRFLAGSDDGHEELQAAVKSAVNFGRILFPH